MGTAAYPAKSSATCPQYSPPRAVLLRSDYPFDVTGSQHHLQWRKFLSGAATRVDFLGYLCKSPFAFLFADIKQLFACLFAPLTKPVAGRLQIGRASCRER